jgi:uncharacterized protein (DUF3084 family)
MYDDALMSGNHDRINRDSRCHRCTANHSNYFFPTHRLKVIQFKTSSSLNVNSEKADANVEGMQVDDIHPRINLQSSEAPSTSCEDDDAFNTLANADYGLEKLREEGLSELSSKYEAKLNVSSTFRALSARLTSDVKEMKVEIKSLRQQINSLETNLEYYKKKHTDLEAQMSDSQPLEQAILNDVNGLLSTKQWYKVMKNNSIANAIAQAVFNNNFSLGIGFDAIISEAKKWLRKNVFTAKLILKQMDLSDGTLNYKGTSILNNVEATSYEGDRIRIWNGLLCTPVCLKRVAKNWNQKEIQFALSVPT